MSGIRVLPPHLANQIAAGEVVERPASVVKELVENSIDSGASSITIEIENGGIDLVSVRDNGSGMSYDDAKTAFLRHATSKIATTEDLAHIITLGFRGEALASIAAVADVTLKTRMAADEQGTLVHIKNGEFLSHSYCAYSGGTAIEVRYLFENIPARLKFLKSVRTEAGYVSDYVSRMIMARPDISFTLINNGRTIYKSYGEGDLRNAILCVYGSDIQNHLRELSFDDGYVQISGFVGTEAISRPNRLQQTVILNGRYIRSASISAALQRAYETRLMSGKFPFAVISMRISGNEVDVNVHPTKMEVRFVDEQRIIRAIGAATHKALIDFPPQESSTMEGTLGSGSGGFTQGMFHSVDLRGETALSGSSAFREVKNHSPYTYAGHSDRKTYGFHEAEYHVSPSETAGETGNGYTAPITWTEKQPTESVPLATGLQYRVIGNAFAGYWILQMGEQLFFVDQHAAHERQLYEKILAKETAIISQQMICPLSVRLSPLERDCLLNNASILEEIGYHFELKDELGVSLLAVPVIHGEPLSESFLHDALAQIAEEGKTSGRELRKERLMQCACKHAVKATETLEKEEIEALLLAYEKEGIPMTCPHGRPVMISLSKRELEKLFKRVL